MDEIYFPPTFDSTIESILKAYPDFNATIKRNLRSKSYEKELGDSINYVVSVSLR
jgi:hypothetical protein